MGKKKIHIIGNSFAVVIDKPICRLLKIDRTTELEMTLVDGRIVLQPIRRADRTGQPDRFALDRMLKVLINQHGMSPAVFQRLSHDGCSMFAFAAVVSVGGYVDLVTVERLAYCLGRRRSVERRELVETWNESADAALAAIPPTSTPPGRNAVSNENTNETVSTLVTNESTRGPGGVPPRGP